VCYVLLLLYYCFTAALLREATRFCPLPPPPVPALCVRWIRCVCTSLLVKKVN
jgi:hypothetical protein